jgi:hypothetical protein
MKSVGFRVGIALIALLIAATLNASTQAKLSPYHPSDNQARLNTQATKLVEFRIEPMALRTPVEPPVVPLPETKAVQWAPAPEVSEPHQPLLSPSLLVRPPPRHS